MIKLSQRVRHWLYNVSLVLFFFLFAGFCSVIPIDSISQASKSSNYALNTFVVVGALVLFGISTAFITSARIYSRKIALQDIPKRYVPLDANDLPKPCLSLINNNFARCEKIKMRATHVSEAIKHPGLSSPNSTTIPPNLCFDDVVKAVGMKLKWSQSIVGTEIVIPKNLSFREIVAYMENKLICTDLKLNRDFVELYEELRYSGKLITEEQFIKFMEFSIDFVRYTRLNIDDDDDENDDDDNDDDDRDDFTGSASFLYTPSMQSRSTFDRLSTYSMRNRSSARQSDSTFFNVLDDTKYEPTDNLESLDPMLQRISTRASISSTATTTRHYRV